MKRIVPCIAAPFLVAVSSSGQNALPPIPTVQTSATSDSIVEASEKRRNASVLQLDFTRFSLRFPGGNIRNFVAELNKGRRKPVNVILPDGADVFTIPAFEVHQITLPSLFAAVSAVSNGKFTFQTHDDQTDLEAIWTFVPGKEASTPREVKYFPVAELLSRFTVEDITTAIHKGWDLLQAKGTVTDPQAISFHEETKLLICAGTPPQLASVSLVLERLGQTPLVFVDRVQQKAKRIIIPRLEFRVAPVREALEFLKKKSFDLDDPNDLNRGINIVLNETKARAEEKISLSLSNISLLECLKIVAELANLELEFREEVLVVKTQPRPQSDATPASSNEQSLPLLPTNSATPGA